MLSDTTKVQIVTAVLLVAVVLSAIAVVYARHEAREQFTELQKLNAERDELEVEWGQLQLEQSSWSTHARVEEQARKKMQMRNPEPGEIKVIEQ